MGGPGKRNPLKQHIPPVVKLYCLEEYVLQGCTLPIALNNVCVLPFQFPSAKCNKLEWSLYVTDECQREKDNLGKHPPYHGKEDRERWQYICYLSNSVPCLMCTGSNVFWLAFLALFLHKSCWKSARHQECLQTMFPISLTVIWKRMQPKKSRTEICIWQMCMYVSQYAFSL